MCFGKEGDDATTGGGLRKHGVKSLRPTQTSLPEKKSKRMAPPPLRRLSARASVGPDLPDGLRGHRHALTDSTNVRLTACPPEIEGFSHLSFSCLLFAFLSTCVIVLMCCLYLSVDIVCLCFCLLFIFSFVVLPFFPSLFAFVSISLDLYPPSLPLV